MIKRLCQVLGSSIATCTQVGNGLDWPYDFASSIPRAYPGLTTYILFVPTPFTMHFCFSPILHE